MSIQQMLFHNALISNHWSSVGALNSAATVSTSTTDGNLVVTVPTGKTVPYGHVLVMVLADGSPATVTDARSNTWNLASSAAGFAPGRVQIWWCQLTTSLFAGDAITVTYNDDGISGTQVRMATVWEYTVPSNYVVSYNGELNANHTSGTTPGSSTIASISDERLFVRGIYGDTSTTTAVPTTGWTAMNEGNYSGTRRLYAEFKDNIGSVASNPTLGTATAYNALHVALIAALATPTVTPTPTPTISVTPTVTPTISVTPTVTPTISVTPSVTASVTPTPTISVTPSVSASAVPPTPSPTPSTSAVVPGTEYLYFTISPDSSGTTNGYVGVLDMNTSTIITTITVGKNPTQIIVNDYSMKAYVVNAGDNTISVINLYTNAVTDTVSMGTNTISSQMVFNDDRSYLYFTADVSGSKYLAKLNTSTLAHGIDNTITYGAGTTGVIISGDRAFGIRSGSSDVAEYSITAQTVTRTFALGSAPASVVANSNKSKLYVGMANGTVKVIDTVGNTVSATITVHSNYTGDLMRLSANDAYLFAFATVSGSSNFFTIDTSTNTVIDTDTIDRIPDAVVNPRNNKVYMLGWQSALGVRIWEYSVGLGSAQQYIVADSSTTAYGRAIDYLEMGLAPSPTPTPTNTPTPTPTISVTPSVTASVTPTPTISVTPSTSPPAPSASATPTPTPSVTPTPSSVAATWSSLGTAGTGTLALTSGTGVRMNVANAASVGEVVVVAVARDNALGGGDSESSAYVDTVTDSKGNTYTAAKRWSNNNTGGATGAAICLFYGVVTTALTTSDTISANYTPSRNTSISAISAWRFSIPSGASVSVASSYTLSSDATQAGSMTATMTATPQHLVVRVTASETKATTWTGTSGWTSIDRAQTTQATDANNMSVGGEFIISDGTSETSNPTFGNYDQASVMAVFEAV